MSYKAEQRGTAGNMTFRPCAAGMLNRLLVVACCANSAESAKTGRASDNDDNAKDKANNRTHHAASGDSTFIRVFTSHRAKDNANQAGNCAERHTKADEIRDDGNNAKYQCCNAHKNSPFWFVESCFSIQFRFLFWWNNATNPMIFVE